MLFKPGIPTKINCKSCHCTCLVASKQYWGHSNKSVNLFTDIISNYVCNPELCGSLRMTHVVYFFDSSLLYDKIDVGWEVVYAHFMEREVPKLLIIVSQIDMLK